MRLQSAMLPTAQFRSVLRSPPWFLDAAAALLVATIGAVASPTVSLITVSQAVYTLVVFGCSTAMLFRRQHPRASLTVMALLLLCQLLFVDGVGVFAGTICVIAAYTTQTRLAPPWRWGVLAVTYGGAIIGVLIAATSALGGDLRSNMIALAAVCAVLTVAALIGIIRRHRQARYDLALERAAILEAQYDTDWRLAKIEERNRIASDMHDILGHSLNAVAIQAEAARYILNTDPDRVDQSLATIGHLSRAAVDEVRDLIDVLHTEDENHPTRPLPALRDIPKLIASYSDVGATIRLRVDQDTNNLPPQTGLAGYRIVQEALTNAIKHAHPSPILIHTTLNEGSLELLITNDAPLTKAVAVKQGHGITGMRQRAHALGGTLQAGPDPRSGGWRVAAHLPWSQS